jgi:tartrate-resistant acid phosphatase type 5
VPRRSSLPIVLAGLALASALAGCAAEPLSVSPAGVRAPSTPAPAATSAEPAAVATTSTEPTSSADATASLVFAVIGDFGTNDSHEAAVATLVASWDPAFVVAAGDDYYRKAGGTGRARYQRSTGAYYGAWLVQHRFYPALGNHDYSDATPSPKTYLAYFDLPGNERYYDVAEGPVHLFVLNSNRQEPAGIKRTSKQARWLRKALRASTSQFNLVIDHHPPYSSDNKHGSTATLQWPFADWGADAVLSGHAHTYERIRRGGVTYVVDGLGGATRYGFSKPVRGSIKRYRSNWGALKITVRDDVLAGEFWSVGGALVDTFAVTPR